jgi:hypothetical protein
MKLDPENKLFWRMNRQRLDAEALRDSMLAISGELTRDSGGPALVLENPDNCGALALKGVNPPNYKHSKPRPTQEFERTLYLPVLRGATAGPDRLRAFFDFVDPAGTAGQRNQTVVPTQSLFLLSNDLLRKRATKLADHFIAAEPNEIARLEALWLRVLNRPITSTEREEATAFRSSKPSKAAPPSTPSSGVNSATASSPRMSSCFGFDPFSCPNSSAYCISKLQSSTPP